MDGNGQYGYFPAFSRRLAGARAFHDGKQSADLQRHHGHADQPPDRGDVHRNGQRTAFLPHRRNLRGSGIQQRDRFPESGEARLFRAGDDAGHQVQFRCQGDRYRREPGIPDDLQRWNGDLELQEPGR